MMERLIEWLNANKICFKEVDGEVLEIAGLGKMFLADLKGVNSIFRGVDDDLQFNLMECPEILMGEGIFYVAFEFGRNFYWYDLREKFAFNVLKYVGTRQATRLNVEFVNLGVHTGYELLNGSGDLSDWVKKTRYLGHSAMGICDHNTMAGTLNLQKECKRQGIRHVFGYSFKLDDGEEKVDMKVYCQSNRGLRHLLRLQKEVMVDSGVNTLSLAGLMSFGEGNVLVFGKGSSYWMQANRHVVRQLEQVYDRVFYQVDLTEYKAERVDVSVLNATKFFFEHFYLPDEDEFVVEPVLICDCYYLDRDEAYNKIILNKIASGAAHEQSDEQYFKDVDEHYAVFEALFDGKKWNVESLFKRACKHTVEIAEGANAAYETGRMFMPEYIMLAEERSKYGNRHDMFLQLLEDGLRDKVKKEEHDRYRRRLEEELYVIESTNNLDYFLIQWDMVREARSRGIAVGIGRGSAGGCLIAYLLGITSIDPIEYDLLFSRFLVPERCGLTWGERTLIEPDVEVSAGESIVRVVMNGCGYHFYRDAEFLVSRNGEVLKVYADELEAGDDVLFDRKDLLWTLNEKRLK